MTRFSHINREKLKRWAKKIGVGGIVFFTLKGLAWLIVPLIVAKGCM